MAGTTGI